MHDFHAIRHYRLYVTERLYIYTQHVNFDCLYGPPFDICACVHLLWINNNRLSSD